MIRMKGKQRRYGRSTGKMTDFKKAIVTLTKDSKEITVVEPA
jgi:ribosomal protein L23